MSSRKEEEATRRSPARVAPHCRNWPPDCDDVPGVELGQRGDEWTFRGSPRALIAAGLLWPEVTPGNPACPHRWAHWASRNGERFGVMWLGGKLVVQLYGKPHPDSREELWK